MRIDLKSSTFHQSFFETHPLTNTYKYIFLLYLALIRYFCVDISPLFMFTILVTSYYNVYLYTNLTVNEIIN